MNRRVALFTSLGLLLAVTLIAVVVMKARQRHRVFFRRAAVTRPAAAQTPSIVTLPVEQWSSGLMALQDASQWELLDEELDLIETQKGDLYDRFQLGYLHGRVRIENDDLSGARKKLTPFLASNHPFRELALHHVAQAAEEQGEDEEASRLRLELIFGFPSSQFRAESIESELVYLSQDNAEKLPQFATRLYPSADTSVRRDIDARSCASAMARGDVSGAIARALLILKGSNSDDASDKTFRAIDQPAVLAKLTPEQLVLLGETARNHRNFERAVAILSAARGKVADPLGEIDFAIGRSQFGNEQYAAAEETYLRGANRVTTAKEKATFFFHASRCAQLLGDDARAERLMTSAIAVPGSFGATSAALTQRLRTRLRLGRFGQAQSDLAALRKFFPREHAVVEATISNAIAMIAANRNTDALRELDSIPRNLLDKYDPYEIAYWRGRAWERSDVNKAVEQYLKVLRADVSTHFAYFTRRRLQGPAFSARLKQEIELRRSRAASLVAEKKFEDARKVQTDLVLLAPNDAQAHAQLEQLYQQLPRYKAILELKPKVLPSFPLAGEESDRGSLLMAMGLFDDAAEVIPRRFPLGSPESSLTQSHALSLGGASKQSILAAEILMNSVPDDFLPELLPALLRRLLYPRYFHDFILEDSKKYDADPRLVVSIMREESRFHPRAKSAAAARGLLQFIITTARQVGRDLGMVELSPDELYDPRVIIQLGAKYVGGLLEQFGRNPYQTAAAYNAGPHQTRLWARLSPAPGDDFFLSSINFDETRHYVRKVLNSYHRYAEIYEGSGVSGGVRVVP